MSKFQDMVRRDIKQVFLNTGEFGERRTIRYDGCQYDDIPVVLTGLKEEERHQLVSDHVEGLYLISSILHCALDDLGGNQPERGRKLSINDEEGGGGFFRSFYVATSNCEMGMLRIELEAIDE